MPALLELPLHLGELLGRPPHQHQRAVLRELERSAVADARRRAGENERLLSLVRHGPAPFINCPVSHLSGQKTQPATMRQSASKPTWLCSSAVRGSLTMKS